MFLVLTIDEWMDQSCALILENLEILLHTLKLNFTTDLAFTLIL